jgi:hypothetical protein
MSDITKYSDLVLSRSGLLAYFPTDAEFGSTELVGGSTSTPMGAPLLTFGDTASPGDALTTTNLNGTTQYVQTAVASGGIYVNGVTRTFEWWSSRDVDTGHRDFLGSAGAGAPPIIRFEPGGAIQFFPRGGSGTNLSVGAAVGAMEHFMLIFNESTNAVTALRNGAVAASGTNTDTWDTANLTNLLYGAGPSGFFDGKFGHLAIYNLDARSYALDHYGLGLSTAASRAPNFGYPQVTNFPSPANLPRGEALGQP